MANVARPSPLRQTRLSFPPMAARRDDAQHGHANHYSPHRPAHAHSRSHAHGIATPHTPPTSATVAAIDDERPIRTHSRKRPATALSPDAAPAARPTARVRVTQPHGELARLTNGLATPLAPITNPASSARSTPRLGSAGKLATTSVALAPGGSTAPQDKRSLRSHDGSSRLKSDLPTYFANYDEIISGLPQSPDLLELDTPIYIVDEPVKSSTALHTPRPTPKSPSRLPSSTAFQVLDYTATVKTLHKDDSLDPLDDLAFFASHRRAERKEKQLRNIEKERAMHEKAQLERLLDGLQGPDWLKVMGITGVTDGERKDWEPKRDYFVQEVEALVDKFRIWKNEEKRLRAEKDAALAAQGASSPSSPEESPEASPEASSERTILTTRHNRSSHPPHRSHPKLPSPPKPRRPPRPHGFLLPGPPPDPLAPFVSFYAKPHLRAAALGKHRHSRTATAFGLPIPDWDEKWFELPRGVLGDGVLKDHARSRRRRKRESGNV